MSHIPSRRLSYASVAAGSRSISSRAGTGANISGDRIDSPQSGREPISPSFGEIHYSEPLSHTDHSDHSEPEQSIVRLPNMTQSTHTTGKESRLLLEDMLHPQFHLGQPWENEMEKEDNLALYGRHTVTGPGRDRFIMPGYLYGSTYMRQLVDKQDKLDEMRREADSVAGLQRSHRPSRSSSSTNLVGQKMVPSHRGMTYEVVESKPPEQYTGGVAPLPSKFCDTELDVIMDGAGLKWPALGSTEDNLAAQTNTHIPVQVGIYYFEVRIDSMAKASRIAVGISGEKQDLHRQPGWDPHSWAWHGDDGKKFGCAMTPTKYDKPYGKGDTIGCGINFATETIFFTRNGHRLEDAFRDVKSHRLYPAVGMKTPGALVVVNFGQEAFKYNIADEVRREKTKVQTEIEKTVLSRVLSERTEDNFIKELVAQFLRHGGYVESAKAFTNEVQTEHRALGTETTISGNAAADDIDAAQRQRIRSAILAGDVDRAVKCTQDFYPEVLDANPVIHFRLKAIKFLEIVRQTCGSTRDAVPVSPQKKEKAKATLPSTAQGNGAQRLGSMPGAMEIDDDTTSAPILPPMTTIASSISWPAEISDEGDEMETSHSNIALDAPLTVSPMLTGNSAVDLQMAIMEGQKLSEEYDKNQRPEIKAVMRHIRGIWAYEDPVRSKEVGYLFKQEERVKVSEDLNSAILVSMGKSAVAAIERMAQQTETLISDFLVDQGEPGAFINLERDLR